jgi:phage terminase large subunit-like protein
MTRVVVAIDPAVTSGEEADETGIVVAGKDKNGHGYVLADISGRYPPTEWARLAIRRLRDARGRPHCRRGQQRQRHGHQVVSFKSPADTPAMPGMLRKSPPTRP